MASALSGRLGEAADHAALARVSGLIAREALILSYNDVLGVIAALFALAVPLVLLLKAPRPGAGGGAAHRGRAGALRRRAPGPYAAA
ncbi:hypothetical protein ACFQX4_03510 [Roseomonas sp. GCM10028921]